MFVSVLDFTKHDFIFQLSIYMYTFVIEIWSTPVVC